MSIQKSLFHAVPICLFLVIILVALSSLIIDKPKESIYIEYIVDPRQQDLRMFWKDNAGDRIGNVSNLKKYAESEGKTLVFAMNGGMFDKSYTPQGLFIDEYQTLQPLDTLQGNGNFYLQPNGVFYITGNGEASICCTAHFRNSRDIRFATQSGPMLLIDGAIHPAFQQGSSNVHIRNGVGVLPDGRVVFAMSKKKVNFYDFASYFLALGCRNALYLDGYVSRTYLPEKDWVQTDGDFGVIIGVVK